MSLKKFLRRLAVGLGIAVLSLLIPLVCFMIFLDFWFGGVSEGPVSHIKNDKYVVSVYSRVGDWATSDNYTVIKVTDLDSFFKQEKTIMIIGYNSDGYLESMDFVNDYTIRLFASVRYGSQKYFDFDIENDSFKRIIDDGY